MNKHVILITKPECQKCDYVKGKIPEGQYGARKVRIWVSGAYETKSWSGTKIEVKLHGKKLSGDYILRWMEKMNSWLLWKR